MANKKIIAIANIERDARNYFLAKMFYCYKDETAHFETAYGIEDEELLKILSDLSCKALSAFTLDRTFGNIVIYNPKSKQRVEAYRTNYTMPGKIITGVNPMQEFVEINYLARMLSLTMKKEDMGEFYVQYKDVIMPLDEFYEFQNKLSIYTV